MTPPSEMLRHCKANWRALPRIDKVKTCAFAVAFTASFDLILSIFINVLLRVMDTRADDQAAIYFPVSVFGSLVVGFIWTMVVAWYLEASKPDNSSRK